MNKKNYPITKPYFTNDEYKKVKEVLKSGWVVQGNNVKEFEKNISEYSNIKYAIATSSCTTALHLLNIAAGIDENSEVVVPSYTFVASSNSFLYLNAKLNFVDIDLNTMTISISHLEEILKKKKIDYLMLVHIFGLVCNMKEIFKLQKKYKFKIIEDAACALGSRYENRHVGSDSLGACLSFHPRKSITTGEGGMILTNNEKIYKFCKIAKEHGADDTDLNRHKNSVNLLPEYSVLGYNYRMTDIQGAIGVSQFDKLEKIMKKKKEIFSFYNEKLSNNLINPNKNSEFTHGMQSYVILLTFNKDLTSLSEKEINILSIKRDNIIKKLNEDNISTRQGTHAVHRLKYYKEKFKFKNFDFKNSYIADKLTISLPCFFKINKKDLKFIVDKFNRYYKEECAE